MRDPNYIPQPSRHAKGYAVVRLNGKDHYLGPYGSAEAKQKYEALIATWLANGRQVPSNETTVNDVILGYLRHAQQYYADSPKEVEKIKLSVRPLKDLFGRDPVSTFGPAKLKAVREKMLEPQTRTFTRTVTEQGKKAKKEHTREYRLSRRTINMRIGVIKRLFKWAVESELAPAFVHQALETVPGLKRGRSGAKEGKKVRPVAEAHVEAVLPHLNRFLRTMVQLQRLTGARSGELCRIKLKDIDRTGELDGKPLWIYRPSKHKNEYRDHPREIFLGPKAVEILTPVLTDDPDAYVFSPKRATEERYTALRANRKSKVPPSQQSRKKADPKRKPGVRYKPSSYRKAILKACKAAQVETWHPHQLRHSAGTYIRKVYGVELARIILGHKTAFTTEIYAEADRAKAMKIMAELG